MDFLHHVGACGLRVELPGFVWNVGFPLVGDPPIVFWPPDHCLIQE